MAASYAALLSLFHTLNHIKQHPRPPISLDQSQVESLTQNLTFLKHFLESYPTYEDDNMESRITDAAYAAEDVIETHIVDQIHARSNITTVDFPDQGRRKVRDLMKEKGMKIKKKVMKIMGFHHSGSKSDHGHGNITSADLYGDLERVIQDMDLIKRDVVETVQQNLMMIPQDAHLYTNSSVSRGPASTWQSSTTPVFDDAIIIQLLDKLVGQQSSLQIVPIVGMGGIGKTTLAKYIYSKPLILQHFDTLAWVTISQEYSSRNTLQLLYQETNGSNNGLSEMSEDTVGEKVYKRLCGRRYLIVMDDIWSIEAWDQVKSFFPNNNNGSRIIITTRLSNLALELSGCHGFQMQFLDEDKSWDLFCKTVFDKLDCPIQLENVGKEIARKCRGLPLSIGVIGGLLRKSNMTLTYWMYTLENLSFIINLENDEYTLRILRTSYRELSMHLKPCFLYMGIFPEDMNIETSELIRLWVAEGILKPIDDKSLEEVANEYLKELIDRNLILVSELGWDEEVRLCKIHDVLRNVCLREAQKQKLFCILRQQKDYIPQGINMERRICINPDKAIDKYSPEFLVAMESASLTRSFLYTLEFDSLMFKASPSLSFRLLRVYSVVDEYKSSVTESNNAIFEQANLRYISLSLCYGGAENRISSLCSLLWNLQTLKGKGISRYSRLIFEIWKMPLIRHVILNSFELPDPPNGEENCVLNNLQTLSGIMNLKFSEEVVKRIPNIKKLELKYGRAGPGDFCLHNLGHLQKLEDLSLIFDITFKVRRNLASFPHSLKKLSLRGTNLSWKELTIRIGSLPLLQYLRLGYNACRGAKWETVEGLFCSLRLLRIFMCYDMKYWETDCTHFPRLEYLHLSELPKLEEIPLNIGDIPTLKRIGISDCRKSALDSAKRIKEEQEENGNEDLQVEIGVIYHFYQEEEEEEEDQEGDQVVSKEGDQIVSDKGDKM